MNVLTTLTSLQLVGANICPTFTDLSLVVLVGGTTLFTISVTLLLVFRLCNLLRTRPVRLTRELDSIEVLTRLVFLLIVDRMTLLGSSWTLEQTMLKFMRCVEIVTILVLPERLLRFGPFIMTCGWRFTPLVNVPMCRCSTLMWLLDSLSRRFLTLARGWHLLKILCSVLVYLLAAISVSVYLTSGLTRSSLLCVVVPSVLTVVLVWMEL